MSDQLLMDKQQIIHNLKLLGEELEALQMTQPIRLLMIGGGYMLTQVGNRLVTEDVDVYTHMNKQTEDYRRFRAAIHFVADDVEVSQKWVSDNIGDFLELLGPIPQGKLWLRHGLLEVYIPAAEYILLLKLMAGREKDVKDVQALCRKFRLKNREQGEGWFHTHVAMYQLDTQIVEDYRESIQKILEQAFEFPGR